MLLRAIERYGRVSAASARHLSSVPGPIECRRRLGKRQMTGVMPESHASPPPWAIEFPWQVGDWKWEAPTAPEDRKLDKPNFSLRQMVDRFIGWLESRDEDIPIIHSPPVADTTIAPTPLQQRVFALREQITQRASIDKTGEVLDLCREFKRGLENMIHLKSVTSADLLLAFNLFNSEITKDLHHTPRWDGITASIGDTIVKSIVSSRPTARHDAYGTDFWLSFLKEVRQLTPQKSTFSLFASCVDALPRADLLDQDDLFDMTKSFVTQESKKGRFKHWNLVELLKPLQRLTPADAEQWRTSLVTFLRALPKDEWKGRFYGLWVLSHHSQTSTDQFLQASSEVCGNRRWGPEEAFWLVKGRLWAWNYLEPKNVGFWLQQTASSRGWSNLVLSIWYAPADVRPTFFFRLCKIADSLGCFETMAKALATEMPRSSSVFRALALGSEDYRIALRLWETIHGSKHGSRAYNIYDWDWTAWTPYLERMIKDPEVDQGLVWKVISLGRTSRNDALPDRAIGGVGSKTQLLDMMSKWYLEVPHLSNRQVLRRIQNCIKHQQRIRKDVSRALLGNMAHAVLRDMENGVLGPASRLDYLVFLVQKYLGNEEAEAALVQIRGWRWTIKNQGGVGQWLKHEKLRQKIEAEVHWEMESREKLEFQELMPRQASREIRRRHQLMGDHRTAAGEGMDNDKAMEDEVFAQMRCLRKESA
ncbi:Fc.00g063710.m01.CDS01 [Cosmosporella sp. VM-42]